MLGIIAGLCIIVLGVIYVIVWVFVQAITESLEAEHGSGVDYSGPVNELTLIFGISFIIIGIILLIIGIVLIAKSK